MARHGATAVQLLVVEFIIVEFFLHLVYHHLHEKSQLGTSEAQPAEERLVLFQLVLAWSAAFLVFQIGSRLF